MTHVLEAADPTAFGLPADCVELVEGFDEGTPGRARDAKHFLHPDGSYTAVLQSSLHYLVGPKQWAEVDCCLEVGRLTVGSDVFEIIGEKINGRLLAQDQLGVVRLESEFGAWVKLHAVDGQQVQSSIDPDDPGAVTYPDVWADADWRLRALPDGIKSDVVLHTAEASTTYRFGFTRSPGLTFEAREDGSVAWVAGGQDVWRFNAPYCIDANGETGPATLTVEAGELVLAGDEAWLAEPGRAFPVVIDPTATIQPSNLDTHTRSTSPTTSYGTAISFPFGYENGGANKGIMRGFVKFDLSSVPSNAVVSAATLSVWSGSTGSDVPGDTFRCQRVTSSWSESTTHNTQPSATATEETSWVGLALGEYPIAITVNTAIITGWLTGSYTNYGFRLSTDTQSGTGVNPYFELYSREWTGDAGHNPQLVITYNRPPSAPTLTGPISGAQIIGTVANNFTMTATDPEAETINGYEIEYRLVGGGSTSTGTQATNTASGGTITHTFAAGTFTQAGGWEWRARTRDAGSNTFGAWSSWASFNVVLGGGFDAIPI